jgi:NRPS condensation-like uncharacterized protein
MLLGFSSTTNNIGPVKKVLVDFIKFEKKFMCNSCQRVVEMMVMVTDETYERSVSLDGFTK